MYMPNSFREDDISILHKLICQYNFAPLISQHEGQLFATHLPFLLDPARGQFGTLQAHLARANPQWRSFGEQEVLVIFEGPHAYVSPSWYEVAPSVPTWNYAVVHAYGKVKILEEFDPGHAFMEDIVQYHEGDFEQPWQMDSLPDDYVHKMMQAVVVFEIEITRLEGKFKLSQNRSAADQQRVAAALAHTDVMDIKSRLTNEA